MVTKWAKTLVTEKDKAGVLVQAILAPNEDGQYGFKSEEDQRTVVEWIVLLLYPILR